MTDDRISIQRSGDCYFIWSVEEFRIAREQYRIVGKPTGSHSKLPVQNQFHSLPILLSFEEAFVLQEENDAKIYELRKLGSTAEDKQVYDQHRERVRMEQSALAHEDRIREKMKYVENIARDRMLSQTLNQKRPSIDGVSSKVAKLDVESAAHPADSSCGDEMAVPTTSTERVASDEKATTKSQGQNIIGVVDPLPAQPPKDWSGLRARKKRKLERDSAIRALPPPSAELLGQIRSEIRQEPVRKLPVDSINLQTWLQSPFPEAEGGDRRRVLLSKDDLKTKKELVRLAVFHNLWKQGFYMTSGMKFACDFLVYPGDPLVVHSSFMAICMVDDQELSAIEQSAIVRLSNQVKKRVLLCYIPKKKANVSGEPDTKEKNDEPSYIILNRSTEDPSIRGRQTVYDSHALFDTLPQDYSAADCYSSFLSNQSEYS